MAQDGGPFVDDPLKACQEELAKLKLSARIYVGMMILRGRKMSSRAQDIAMKAYDIGLQVGATLSDCDDAITEHLASYGSLTREALEKEQFHMSRDEWLAARRAMAIKEACS